MATREAVKVSGKSIAAFYERMGVGAQVECIENTYIPSRAGIVGTVLRPGKTSLDLEVAGVRGYQMSTPRRVSDVLEMTDDTIKYNLESRDGHTVTWRIVIETVR